MRLRALADKLVIATAALLRCDLAPSAVDRHIAYATRPARDPRVHVAHSIPDRLPVHLRARDSTSGRTLILQSLNRQARHLRHDVLVDHHPGFPLAFHTGDGHGTLSSRRLNTANNPDSQFYWCGEDRAPDVAPPCQHTTATCTRPLRRLNITWDPVGQQFVTAYGAKSSTLITNTLSSAVMGQPIPVVYGTGWINAKPIATVGDGNYTRFETVAALGPLSYVLNFVVNGEQLSPANNPDGSSSGVPNKDFRYNWINNGRRDGAPKLNSGTTGAGYITPAAAYTGSTDGYFNRSTNANHGFGASGTPSVMEMYDTLAPSGTGQKLGVQPISFSTGGSLANTVASVNLAAAPGSTVGQMWEVSGTVIFTGTITCTAGTFAATVTWTDGRGTNSYSPVSIAYGSLSSAAASGTTLGGQYNFSFQFVQRSAVAPTFATTLPTCTALPYDWFVSARRLG